MIARHRLNSDWWGAPVGLIEDAAFLQLTAAEQRAMLGEYAWVEYRGTFNPAAALRLHDLGFLHAESYCRCRVGLNRIDASPSVASMRAITAVDKPFALHGAFAPFEKERFDLLPGITAARVGARYEQYIADVIAATPATCLEIVNDHGVQGWFFAEPRSSDSIQLSLATRHRNATVSGAHMYQRALLEYARQGYRIGTATFSVRHADVMNIYSRVGALFVEPLEIWLRVASNDRSVSQT